MIIKGEKVVLREKRMEDAADDYAWRCDPELARFDAVSPLRMSFSDYTALYKEEMKYSSPRQRNFAIEDLDGKHIGNCMYYDIDERNGQAELGIMIGDRDYWSKSYGTDTVTTLLRHVFETTSLKRVYLNTLDWNIRAQRCFEKSGFVSIRKTTRDKHNFITMEIYKDWWEEKESLEKGEAHGN